MVVAGLLYLHSSAFRHSIERRAESWLTQEFGREAHLRLERLGPLTLSAEVADLRIAGGDPGTNFVELARGSVDLKVWPLLRGRVEASELTLEGLTVDLAQAPGPGTEAAPAAEGEVPLPSLAALLERFSIDRGTLTGGSIHLGDASWPAEFRGQGIECGIDRLPGSASYRLRASVGEGSARLAGGEWFAIGASAEAELDVAGLRIGDLRLTAPGARVGGRAALDGLDPLVGSLDADGSFELPALPWPAQAGGDLRPAGTVDAEAHVRFEGREVSVTARLTSERLVFRDVSATAVDLRLSGADGHWTSELELEVGGALIRGVANGPLTTELTPLEGEVSWSVGDLASLAPLVRSIAGLRGVASTPFPLSGRLEGSLTARVESWVPEGIAGRFAVEAADVAPRVRPQATVAAHARGSFAAGELELESLTARGIGMTLSATGRADLARRSELDLELRRDPGAGDALQGLLAFLEVAGVEPGIAPTAGRLAGDIGLTAHLRGPGLEALALDAIAGDLALTTRGLTAAGADGLPLDADVRLDLAGGRLAVRAAEISGPGTRLTLDGTLDTGAIDASIAFHAAAGTGSRLSTELSALGLAGVLPPAVVARLGDARLDARLGGPWSSMSGTARLELTALGSAPDAEPRTLTASARLDRGALDVEAKLDGGASYVDVGAHIDQYDRWPPRGTARFEGVETVPSFWAVADDWTRAIEGRIAASGTVDLEARQAQAVVGVTGGRVAGSAFELSEAGITVDVDRIEIAGARLQALGGELTVDGALGAAGAGVKIRAESLQLADLVRAAGADLDVAGTLGLDATFTGTAAAPRLEATVSTAGLALEGQPLADLAGKLAYDAGALEFDLAGPAGTDARIAGRLRPETPTTWSVTADYPVLFDLNRWTATPEAGPLEFRSRVVADLRGSGTGTGDVEGRVDLRETRFTVGADVFVPREDPVVTLAAGRAQLAPFRVDVAGAALEVHADLPLDPAAAMSAGVEGRLPLRSLSSQVPGGRLDGIADLRLSVGGTPQRPEWNGELAVSDGRVDYPRLLPAPLERINGTLVLTPDLWSIGPVELQLGGGRVSGSGTYRPAAGERRGDLQLEVVGQDVRLPPILGLRSQFDADVRLSGAPGGTLTVAGRLNCDRAVYATDVDLQRELLSKVRTANVFDEVGGVLDRIRLDLQVEAPGTLFVRNNLASLQTTTSLAIAGTAADPLVTGRVELQEGGTVEFRDVTYSVARGTLDYNADPPDNPRLDIEGHTSVGSYDIVLLVSGRLADPQVDLTSTPPVSQADIVSLLVTGKTRDDLASSGAGMSETQAALYLGQGITRDVERTVARSLGLDQVTLDPTLIAAEGDPAARLTVGKAITGRVFGSYSREIGGTGADIYQLRFTPFEHLSLLAQQDDDEEILGDAVYEQKFYVGPKRAEPEGAGPESSRRISSIAFEGVHAFEQRRLKRALGLHTGRRFRPGLLLDGVETIRELYLDRGYPEATVDPSVEEVAGEVRIVVRVNEGREVEVVANGPRASKLRRAVMDLWQQSVFQDEIADDARRRALELMADAGYVDATVEARLTATSPERAELVLDVQPGRRVRIERLAIEGNQAIDTDTIRQQFLSLGDSVLRRDWLRPAVLAEDCDAVRSLYFGRGYLDVRVDPPRVTYPGDAGKALVTVAIDEGPRYDLGGVSFTGNAVYDDERLREVAGLSVGRPYVDAEVRHARTLLRGFYDENGYPGTQIDVSRSTDRPSARADLQFSVEEAPHAVIESIHIDNPGRTRDRVVQEKVDLAPGDPLSADRLVKTRQELYRTGLFRSVSLVDLPGETAEGRRVELTLDERTNVRTQTGLGYGTDQGVRGMFNVSHSNLGGERLYGSTGVRASETDWRVYGVLRQPDLFRTRLQGLLSTSIEQEGHETFDVRRKETSVQIAPDRTDRKFHWFVGYGVQEADIFRDGVEIDPGSGEIPDLGELIDLRTDSPQLLADLRAGWIVGKRDDFLWPTRGNVLNAKISVFDSLFLSEAEFVRASAQWSFYHPAGSGRIWAVGVRLGLAEPYAQQNAVPLSERFFLGGDSTVRGYRRDSIVAVGFPQQAFDDAGIELTESLGGEASLVFNQELIFPFFKPVSLVAFHDAGNLYWRRSDLDPGDLRHAAGLGLRLRTPFGPIRLEYAWKLNHLDDGDSGRFHFSIGVPF